MIPSVVFRIVSSKIFQEFAATIVVGVMALIAFMAVIEAIVEVGP